MMSFIHDVIVDFSLDVANNSVRLVSSFILVSTSGCNLFCIFPPLLGIGFSHVGDCRIFRPGDKTSSLLLFFPLPLFPSDPLLSNSSGVFLRMPLLIEPPIHKRVIFSVPRRGCANFTRPHSCSTKLVETWPPFVRPPLDRISLSLLLILRSLRTMFLIVLGYRLP